MPKIDAHAHVVGSGPADPAFFSLLERHAMRWIDICWYEDDAGFARQRKTGRRLSRELPRLFSWITTFPLSGFPGRTWTDRAIADVEEGRADGAVGVKVWKNIGMELKDADGRFVMIDDPRFDPVLERVQASGLTLAAHIGEPRNAWLPLEEMTVAGDRSYFSAHPEYHGLNRPEIPGYWEQVASRDRMLERHPGLRVVGCHLGSLEFDVRELAERLDRYPSFAVDLSARTCHLQCQPREVVREFLVKYQDRILYGMDMGWDGSQADRTGLATHLERLDAAYRLDYRYFAGSGEMPATAVGPDARCEALALPDPVLEKIFRKNALAWYPKIGGA
jgi:hypothetical protein